ncbi:MAG: hypothetical protein C4312_08085 [Thermoflexus sp.]
MAVLGPIIWGNIYFQLFLFHLWLVKLLLHAYLEMTMVAFWLFLMVLEGEFVCCFLINPFYLIVC